MTIFSLQASMSCQTLPNNIINQKRTHLILPLYRAIRFHNSNNREMVIWGEQVFHSWLLFKIEKQLQQLIKVREKSTGVKYLRISFPLKTCFTIPIVLKLDISVNWKITNQARMKIWMLRAVGLGNQHFHQETRIHQVLDMMDKRSRQNRGTFIMDGPSKVAFKALATNAQGDKNKFKPELAKVKWDKVLASNIDCQKYLKMNLSSCSQLQEIFRCNYYQPISKYYQTTTNII